MKGGGVEFADGFAIPAFAFGVDFAEHFLVRLACPFEGFGEFGLFDFVVVADEAGGLLERVGVVGGRTELVGVPG